MDGDTTLMLAGAYLIAGLVLGTAANVLAGKKGLSRQRWGLISFVGGALFVLPGIVVLVVLALKPRLEPVGAQPPQVQATPPPESSPPQFQSPPTLQMPVGPPPVPKSGDAPPQGVQFQTPPTLQMPVGP